MIPKFRVWIKKDNKNYMSDSCFTIHFFENKISFFEIDYSFLDYHNLEEDEYVLMQSTGLKDIYHKEIFEGDIVKVLYDIDDEYGIMEEIGIIVYNQDDASFEIKYTNRDIACELPLWMISDRASFEIIGNIYENPELLEDK